MGEFEKINRSGSCESDGLEELEDIKNEKSEDIDKEKYKGLKKWMEIKKKEEQAKKRKGLLKRLLSNKKEDNVEQYTIEKLDRLVLQASNEHNKDSPLKKRVVS